MTQTKGQQEVRRAWHTLERDEVEGVLETGAHGLSRVEVEARQRRYGPNQLEELAPPSTLTILLHQFQSPLIYILIVAAVVTVVLEEYIDAGVITAVLLLNAVIGFTQERQAEISVRALMGLVAPRARVVREGREWEVDSRELVPGDLVLLESGSRVPADVRLIAATALSVDESLLTGESIPVRKQTGRLEEDVLLADRSNLAYAGSVVTSGRGRGYVVETGIRTQLGAIAESVRGEEEPETPLQRRMSQFARVIGVVVGVAALLAFVIGLAIGETLQDMFLVAVALAVAAIPEGLPVAFTITLAIGVRRMARRNAIIRRLPAVETLGSTTVIGSDKTGTLTENRMTVQEVWAGGRTYSTSEEIEQELPEPLHLTLLAGVLTNEAQVYLTEGDGFDSKGDPTEVALLVAATRWNLEPEEAREEFEVYAEIPFEPDRQYSASIREKDGDHIIFVKGAPERVLGMSAKALTEDGPGDLDTDAVHQAASEMAARGLRVLAMAYRPLPHGPGPAEDLPDPEGLVFLGLQGMKDPPRAGVHQAIEGCQDAGIRVLMITGDHAATAAAIGSELGIAAADAPVLTGADLAGMDDEALARRVREVSVYARAAPDDKLRIVRALRAHNEVVAVTGDGVNDAPALKVADIGVAMGKSGTDVAKEASDMVLADDNFVSIYSAVEEGRVTFDNVRKVTFFLVSTGAATILTILTSLALGWPLPFLPAQLLWLNLVTNGLQDVALAFEPGEAGVLRRPPRRPNEGVISSLLWERTLVAGVVMAAGSLLLFRWELDRSDSLTLAQTTALTTMVLFMAFHVGNSRSEFMSAFRKSPISNPFLFIATVAALAVHVAALYLPPTQYVLRVEPIGLEGWVRIVIVALTIIVAIEIHKLFRRGKRPELAANQVSRA